MASVKINSWLRLCFVKRISYHFVCTVTVAVDSDKDNNSAVISLGEMFSDNAGQHLSSAGSPPPPAVNGATADDAHPQRVSVNRCGSPPTGRSVSFQCGQVHRCETDVSGAGRSFGRRQSGEPKEVAATSSSVVGFTQHHVEGELESVRSDSSIVATTSASGGRVCKCVNSPPSKLADVEGCRPASGGGHGPHKSQLTSDVDADETSPSHLAIKQTVAPDCCVIHVSSSS